LFVITGGNKSKTCNGLTFRARIAKVRGRI